MNSALSSRAVTGTRQTICPAWAAGMAVSVFAHHQKHSPVAISQLKASTVPSAGVQWMGRACSAARARGAVASALTAICQKVCVQKGVRQPPCRWPWRR